MSPMAKMCSTLVRCRRSAGMKPRSSDVHAPRSRRRCGGRSGRRPTATSTRSNVSSAGASPVPPTFSKETRRPVSSGDIPVTLVDSRIDSYRARIRFSSGLTRSRSQPGMRPSMSSTTVTREPRAAYTVGHLQPDDAAADDEEAPGYLVEHQRIGGVHQPRIVVGEAGDLDRLRAGRDDRVPEFDPGGSAGTCDAQPMRRRERALAVHDLDVALLREAREVRGSAVPRPCSSTPRASRRRSTAARTRRRAPPSPPPRR